MKLVYTGRLLHSVQRKEGTGRAAVYQSPYCCIMVR